MYSYFIIIGVIAALLIVVLWLMQESANSAKTREVAAASKALLSSEQVARLAKEDVLSSISEIYGSYDATKVREGKIWIGMDRELLLASLGKASSVKAGYENKVSVERWYYNRSLGDSKSINFKMEILLENNKIISWKDLA